MTLIVVGNFNVEEIMSLIEDNQNKKIIKIKNQLKDLYHMNQLKYLKKLVKRLPISQLHLLVLVSSYRQKII